MKKHQAAMLLLFLPLTAALLCAENGDQISTRARKLHFGSLVIDTHVDTTSKLLVPGWDFTAEHQDGHLDLPRLKKGGLSGLFFSIFVPGTVTGPRAVNAALERIAAVYRLADDYPDQIVVCTTADEVRAAHRQGRIAALLGMEGGHMINDSLSILQIYARLGVRYLTLTHSLNVDWADSSGDQPRHNGLTDFGKSVVEELNRLGVIVDISHVSDATFWNALEVSRAPMIASHSSCRALTNHPRNMTDEMIKALASKGGVIQINYHIEFLDNGAAAYFRKSEPLVDEYMSKHPGRDSYRTAREEVIRKLGPMPKVSWERIVDNIDHAVKLVGAEHVGLGSDFDGATMPEGLEDVSKLPKITEALLRRGYSESDIRKILGENTLRVLSEVERIGRSLRAHSGK